MSPVYVFATEARVSLATPTASSNGVSSQDETSNAALMCSGMVLAPLVGVHIGGRHR